MLSAGEGRTEGPWCGERNVVVRARLKDDGTVVEGLRDGSERPLVPEVDWARVDATTEAEIAAQIAEDDAEAMRDTAAYARRVRRKVGLSQVAFARRIGVPVETVRNWEQGKRSPRGPARGAAPNHRARAREGTCGSGQVPTAPPARSCLSSPVSLRRSLLPAAQPSRRPPLADAARIPTVPWTRRTYG